MCPNISRGEIFVDIFVFSVDKYFGASHSCFAMKKTRTQVLDGKPITEAQFAVLKAIRVHVAKYRISPTLDEIRLAIGRAKRTVRDSIKPLVAKGYLELAPGRFRNLIVTNKGMKAAKKRSK